MSLGWKKIRQKVIRINKYRSLDEKHFKIPNGEVADFYTWHAMSVVGVVVLTKDHRVVLAKQFRPGPEKILWELPSGAIKKRETPRQAAVRETLEETGYRGVVHPLGSTWIDAWSGARRYHFLMTESVLVSEPKPDRYEVIEVVTVTLKAFQAMLMTDKITEAATGFRALQYLKQQGTGNKLRQALQS